MSTYKLSFKTPAELLKYIKEQDIRFIDYNFSDLHGKWNHMSLCAKSFTKDSLEHGITLNDNSGKILRPDIARVSYDPFAAQRTIKVFCDVYDSDSSEHLKDSPFALDPRGTVKRARKYLQESSIADDIYFAPDVSFFVFDDVRFETTPQCSTFYLDSEENPENAGRNYETGNMGHRMFSPMGKASERLLEAPVDRLSDLRAEMVSVIESMGVDVRMHKHEHAPAQCSISLCDTSMLEAADSLQLFKYAVHNVAHSYGKSATFMPKPLNGVGTSFMALNHDLRKNGKSLFAGNAAHGLSEKALFYIGGIIKHAKTLCAFTNPTANSYKSHLPSTTLCHIERNSPPTGLIQTPFPHSAANTYLALPALLMAGLDGIKNKIHPEDISSPDDFSFKGKTPASLRAALQALKDDHEFLLQGNVFTKELINAYEDLKMQELDYCESNTHPAELALYYSS